jgi:hypothetical protein
MSVDEVNETIRRLANRRDMSPADAVRDLRLVAEYVDARIAEIVDGPWPWPECEFCGDTGKRICETCNGAGTTTPWEVARYQYTCPTCKGDGEVKCERCKGCGACCRERGYPRFTRAELDRLPAPVRAAYDAAMATLDAPVDDEHRCLWLTADGECEHYDDRPRECREEIEPGDEACELFRREYPPTCEFCGGDGERNCPGCNPPPSLREAEALKTHVCEVCGDEGVIKCDCGGGGQDQAVVRRHAGCGPKPKEA